MNEAVDPTYIWQRSGWPQLDLDWQRALPALVEARRSFGELEGKLQVIGMAQGHILERASMEGEVCATAAIEGQKLDPEAVRSSVMRRLGLAAAGRRDRVVEGLVAVVDEATSGLAALDESRLHRWQAALFPDGASGLLNVTTGRFRAHSEPMQIVSGPAGRHVVHYEAPPSSSVPAEMARFLRWLSSTGPSAPDGADRADRAIDGLARAAIAHLWFETIHPYEDGNGRIGRAIADFALVQAHGRGARMVSLSQEIHRHRDAYYEQLNAAQRDAGSAGAAGNMERLTAWVIWFAQRYRSACDHACRVIDQAVAKNRFWAEHAAAGLNERQRKMVQRLLDAGDGGFVGGLDVRKYMGATGATKPSATRDLAALVQGGMLRTSGRGKALRYYVAVPGWAHGVEPAPVEPEADVDRRLVGADIAGGAGRQRPAPVFTRSEIDAFFAHSPMDRPVARYDEAMLDPEACSLDADRADRCLQIQARALPVDAKFLTNFLTDFAWGMSNLEGGSYSRLDTQAMVDYGTRNKDKPAADTVLVFNCIQAAKHLWSNRALSVENICAMHALLTSDQAIAGAVDSEHFLPEYQRGRVRDLEDVGLGSSAYIPPFRPGTGYVLQAFERVVENARALAEVQPVQSALYLMTRIPYLQVFANGNKRASRIAANLPLLSAGALPISFADIDKADYIRGMAAFYELGSGHVIEQTFIRGYARSVARASTLPVDMRMKGVDVDGLTGELVGFINTGEYPRSREARLFIGERAVGAGRTDGPSEPRERLR